MRIKNSIFAGTLAAIMAVSFAGCQANTSATSADVSTSASEEVQDKDFFAQLNELQTYGKSGTFQMGFKMADASNTISADLTGAANGTILHIDNASFTQTATLVGTPTEMSFKDIFISPTEVYISTDSFKDIVVSMSNQSSDDMKASFEASYGDAEYLRIPIESATGIATSGVNVPKLNITFEDFNKAVTETLLPELAELFKPLEADSIETKGNVSIVKIDNNNLPKLLDGIVGMIDNGSFLTLANKMGTVNITEEDVSAIKQSLLSIKEKLASDNKVSLVIKVETSGEAPNRTVEIALSFDMIAEYAIEDGEIVASTAENNQVEHRTLEFVFKYTETAAEIKLPTEKVADFSPALGTTNEAVQTVINMTSEPEIIAPNN